MKIVSINTGKEVEKDEIQIRKPTSPCNFDVERHGNKVTMTADHYAYLNEMKTFYQDLYLSSLRSYNVLLDSYNRSRGIQ